MSENKSKALAGSISYVMIIMVLSRLLSLVSTQVYMSFFGLDSFLNIYSYAITIPNTIFNCFGTALGTVFIPIYAGHLATGDDKRAARFADAIITVSTAFTAVLVLIGIAISPILPKFTAFNSGEEYNFAVKALMCMMPVMLFYGLNYILQGVLQSRGKYGWPAFVSVPSSLVVIIYVFTLGDRFGVAGLLAATFLGLSLQALILIPPAIKAGLRYHVRFTLKDPDIRKAGSMTLPVLLGVSAYQFNMFFNTTMIANFDGMVTLLNYVQNIVIYMVLAFVYSVTAVIYPKLTESFSRGDTDGYKSTLSGVLQSMTALLIPVSFGFISARKPLLELIANYGKITDSDIEKAAILMAMYSIGILGVGLKEILDRAFYACKNTFLPAVNGFVIMAFNVTLSLILTRFMGAYGIPLAYSLSSLIGLCVLCTLLRKKVGPYAKGLGTTLVKCIVSGAVMALFVTAVNYGLSLALPSVSVAARIIKLAIPVAAGVVVYALMTLILKVNAVLTVLDAVKRKLGKSGTAV